MPCAQAVLHGTIETPPRFLWDFLLCTPLDLTNVAVGAGETQLPSMLDAVLRSLVIYGLAISVAGGAARKHHRFWCGHCVFR